MTENGAIDVLQNEIRCVKNETCKREECKYCYLVMPDDFVLEALEMGIKALLKEQAVKKAIEEIEDRVKEEVSTDDAWTGGLSYALYVLKIHLKKTEYSEYSENSENERRDDE